MNWNEVSDAIVDCDVQRLDGLFVGRKRPCWDDHFTSPPLFHLAALAKDNAVEMMKILSRVGMDVNEFDHRRWTALQAFLGGMSDMDHHRGGTPPVEVVTALLQLGCDPMNRDEYGQTALHLLIQNDSKHDLNPCIDILLSFVKESERASYVNATNAAGRSAIFYASIYFSPKRISKLLDLDADPFVGNRTSTGSFILHQCLCRTDAKNQATLLPVVTKLLKLGCDPKAQNEKGQTALHILMANCSGYDFDRFISLLLSFVVEEERISYVNTVDADGKSAIFYTTLYYSPYRANKLLDHTTNPFVGNPFGSAILHKLLSLRGKVDEDDIVLAVTKLLELGCDPRVRDESGRTALHVLVQNDPKYELNFCIDALVSFVDKRKRKSFVNATDADGKSAIFYSTTNFFSPTRANKLLDHMADPFVGNTFGSSILHELLSLRGKVDEDDLVFAVPKLLKRGCDPMAQDESWRTALHVLVRNDHKYDLNSCIDTLVTFVDRKKRDSFVNATDAEGKSAIFYAAHFFSPTRVNKLLDLSADPFVGNPTGSSILHKLFSLHGDCDEDDLILAVTKLLELGCDPTAKNENGQTALHLLVRNDSKYDLNPCIDALLSFVEESKRTTYVNATDAEGRSAIFYATIYFSPRRINKLLDHKADPFVWNRTGSFILHRLLINMGDDGDDSDNDEDNDDDDESRIHTEGNALHAIIKLLELGCDPKTQDVNGQTSLHILMKNSSGFDFDRVFSLLLSHVDESDRKSFVNTTDADGKSAIFLVMSYESSSTAIKRMRTLLRAGVDINSTDNKGRTILHAAVKKGTSSSSDMIPFLLENAVDVNRRDETGHTALHLLTSRTLEHRRTKSRDGQTKKTRDQQTMKSRIASQLLDHGADPTIVDDEGHPPLNYLGDRNTYDPTVTFQLLQYMVGESFQCGF